jgi:hypothetical protein
VGTLQRLAVAAGGRRPVALTDFGTQPKDTATVTSSPFFYEVF